MNQYFIIQKEEGGPYVLSPRCDSEEAAAQWVYGCHSWQCEKVKPVGDNLIEARQKLHEFSVIDCTAP